MPLADGSARLTRQKWNYNGFVHEGPPNLSDTAGTDRGFALRPRPQSRLRPAQTAPAPSAAGAAGGLSRGAYRDAAASIHRSPPTRTPFTSARPPRNTTLKAVHSAAACIPASPSAGSKVHESAANAAR